MSLTDMFMYLKAAMDSELDQVTYKKKEWVYVYECVDFVNMFRGMYVSVCVCVGDFVTCISMLYNAGQNDK
jgi:hypothetical protein